MDNNGRFPRDSRHCFGDNQRFEVEKPDRDWWWVIAAFVVFVIVIIMVPNA
jgi:hypothetical protein